ncbi:hypothetical protein [Streptomyces rapamycinicus]|uniref:Uncharacterized protein n=2 Tax=Streptomyces rapamycinicus TaxID=1226757 RepID=A0A0A0N3M0_STRRN|nr:hypothetical protein [Streptomyces rapamycinicus]AGP52447.1 hypothetical protein M271_04085 [Streptomyces rapamycinicus NRRL 5491]MBB4779915.1 hypothetical protein [Streptomyces rapamycinicus]RLV75430.1 hypothetical protein D3C57_139430 [Streptomyces rapamycinicus NRRL 5491]UTP28625.1 hypothetical protein LIV37_04230 [Streptomyces rapamycinicus NRRL 5491]
MSDETVEVWYARVRLRLAALSVPGDTADTVLTEVGQHRAESGEHPREAFGSPAEFAATVAAERVPDQVRAARDRDGLTPADRRSGVFGLLGMSTVVAGVLLWISTGGSLPLTLAGLAGTALTALALATALVAAHGPRSASRRRAVGWWSASAATTILAAIAFTALPRTGLGRLPTPIVCLVGIALMAIWFAVPGKPTSKGGLDVIPETVHSPEEWLRILPRLLEERHGLSRARAAELTEEAARHVIDAERAPRDEFGPVGLYALRLAEQEPSRVRRLTRGDTRAAIFTVCSAMGLTLSLVNDEPLGLTFGSGALSLVGAGMFVSRFQRSRMPGPRT